MNDLQTLFTDYIIQKNIFYIFLGVFSHLSYFTTTWWWNKREKIR